MSATMANPAAGASTCLGGRADRTSWRTATV